MVREISVPWMDPPAAMRYTEIRLGKVADTLLEDIDKDTVNFVDNYDTTLTGEVLQQDILIY